jgi:hypothetical protein
MAQNFTNFKETVGSGATDLLTATTNDTLIGLRCANILLTPIVIDVWIFVNGVGTYYFVKNATLGVGASLELMNGGSRLNLQNNDVLRASTDTTGGMSVIGSVVAAISA